MITRAAAAAILEGLVERKKIESKVMIVVAHPDDETIGMGAQLCRFHDALLVQVTDGAPRDGRDAAAHGYATIPDYAAARHVELAAALEIGEAHGARTEFSGIADQEACFKLAMLIERISELMQWKPEKQSSFMLTKADIPTTTRPALPLALLAG